MNVQVENPNRQLNPCDELRDLLPAYAIGALTESETAHVRALLLECPEAAAELPEYAALLSALTLNAEPVVPPPALLDRIMAAAASQPAAPQFTAPSPSAESSPAAAASPSVVPTRRAAPRRLIPVRITLIAAAAAALLILSNAYWLGQLGALRTERDRLDSVLSAFEAGSAGVVELLSAENVVYARVIFDPATGSAVLFGESLPPLPEDRTYQLWLLNDAAVTSAGTFRLLGEQGVTHILPPLTPPAAFAISIEPLGGSPNPTTDPIAIGDVPDTFSGDV